MMSEYLIGIDYGTLSARAVLVDSTNGKIIAEAEKKYKHGVMDISLPCGIKLEKNSAYQHPEDYLECLSYVIRQVVSDAKISASDVVGIGMDFTSCTMLPVDENCVPLCMLKEFESEPHAYVKLWKHHSAQAEADYITDKAIENHEEWISLYGGKVSSEWLFPKLLETLNKAPDVYEKTYRFVEAADWITWKITGNEIHSSCMAGYKGMWNSEDGYPSNEFLESVNPKLGGIVGNKISEKILPPGTKAGELNEYGAELTGLNPGTAVSVPIIDAHAALPGNGIVSDKKMILIIGTSTCHIVMSKKQKKVPKICGSVKDGIIPGYIAYEAGQAAVGDCFDWFVKNCVPAHYCKSAAEENKSIFELLNEKACRKSVFQSGLVALDWWNGNRTPYADYDLSGMIVGLNMNTAPEDIYRALIESTAFGTKEIIDLYLENGIETDEIYASGGISQKNSFLMQIYADVLGKKITVPALLQAGAKGSAILASCACGIYKTFEEAARNMCDNNVTVYFPNYENTKKYRELYEIYKSVSDFFGQTNNTIMKKLKNLK